MAGAPGKMVGLCLAMSLSMSMGVYWGTGTTAAARRAGMTAHTESP